MMTTSQKLFAARAVRMPTLADAMLANVMAPSTATSALIKAALVVFGSLLLAVSAQFKIPLYPVPVTGQTLVVLLIGMTYGPRFGGITMVAYLFEGAIGLPVFAGGAAGMAVLFGPTGGYLLGFLLAAVAMGYLAERGMGRSVVSTVIAMVIGNMVIYLCGASWLASFIGFGKAMAAGVLPFLYGDALKLAVAAGLIPLAWRAVKAAQK
jgi:biotin transport system substrate-specific component